MNRMTRFSALCALTLMVVAGFSMTLGTNESSAESPMYRIVIMPKLIGIDYYNVVKQGIDDAQKELADKVDVKWIGPTTPEADKQIELIRSIIPTKPDLIAVAADDAAALVPVFKEAQKTGIHVISWDGDVNYREAFVNLVDYDAFGAALADSVSNQIGNQGDIVIITTTFTAPNQVRWIAAIKKELSSKYPNVTILDTRAVGEDTNKAFQAAQSIISTNPSVKGFIVLGVPNVPGVAEAVKEAGMAGKIAVVGNPTPNTIRDYIKDGVVKEGFLWNAPDHGYLTVYTAYTLLEGKLKVGTPFEAGRLGTFTPKKDDISMEVALPILKFDKKNIDKYNF